MAELPADVASELDKLYRLDEVPPHAMTVKQIVKERGGSLNAWRRRLAKAVEDGTWMRGRKEHSTSYWYWPK